MKTNMAVVIPKPRVMVGASLETSGFLQRQGISIGSAAIVLHEKSTIGRDVR